jgi:hypothetical protein
MVGAVVSNETFLLMNKLMALPPVLRLTINLRNLMVEQSIRIVRNWVESLAPEERAALSELEQRGVPAELMEVAHGLFNIHERWSVMKSTAKAFREARPLGECILDERPLDNILRIQR